ncbi:uncharacterized protein BX663DRAFT_527262, partial [Cokeromyces recurvatus]|uniref:uncharacterized protein n=1 Tax=Cokeromyces recurvatus TaxID=90255 RepID=UPI002220453A
MCIYKMISLLLLSIFCCQINHHFHVMFSVCCIGLMIMLSNNKNTSVIILYAYHIHIFFFFTI